MALQLTNERVDRSATDSLQKMKKLRAKYEPGDMSGAVVSAGYYAKKLGQTMFVYAGNSYGWSVYRVSSKTGEYLDPISNTGDKVISVSPDLVVTFYDVVRTQPAGRGLKNRLLR